MRLVLPWVVPGVEGQIVMQTLRAQEAGGAGPTLLGCGCLSNLAVGLQGGGMPRTWGGCDWVGRLVSSERTHAIVTSLSPCDPQ